MSPQRACAAVVFLLSAYSQWGKIAELHDINCLIVHMTINWVFLGRTPCSSVNLISPGAPRASDWHRLGSASLAEAVSSKPYRARGRPDTWQVGFHN